MRPDINANQNIQYRLDIKAESEWISVTPCIMAQDAFLYVQEAGHFYCGSDYFTKREKLWSFLIKCTLSGHGKLDYRGKTYELGSGDLFFVDCDEAQHYRTEGESWEQIWIHFNGACTSDYFRHFYEAAGCCVVHLSSPGIIANHIHKIISLYRVGGVYADILASKLLMEILTELMVAATGVKDDAAHLPRSITQAVRIMEEQYTHKITLESLSQQVSMNKQYFQKLFKKHMAVTPHTFLESVRINHAKELLRFSDLYVGEIAADVGMENASHFVKLFKRVAGVTPSAYRKMWNP